MTQAYPLQWPEGWPRRPVGRRDDSRLRFSRPGEGYARRLWTFADARDALFDEVQRLGGTLPVLSSNFAVDRYGNPTDRGRRPEDEAVAVYFTLADKPVAMACDLHLRAEENMRSLALSIEALRALARHGGGTMRERTFEGFARLEAPGAKRRWRVLGVAESASQNEIETAFRSLARERHPDHGGSDAMMAELNRGRTEGLKTK